MREEEMVVVVVVAIGGEVGSERGGEARGEGGRYPDRRLVIKTLSCSSASLDAMQADILAFGL